MRQDHLERRVDRAEVSAKRDDAFRGRRARRADGRARALRDVDVRARRLADVLDHRAALPDDDAALGVG